MTLMKLDLVEQIQTQFGFPKNQSAEITEILLEI
jgi:hypothetical protein